MQYAKSRKLGPLALLQLCQSVAARHPMHSSALGYVWHRISDRACNSPSWVWACEDALTTAGSKAIAQLHDGVADQATLLQLLGFVRFLASASDQQGPEERVSIHRYECSWREEWLPLLASGSSEGVQALLIVVEVFSPDGMLPNSCEAALKRVITNMRSPPLIRSALEGDVLQNNNILDCFKYYSSECFEGLQCEAQLRDIIKQQLDDMPQERSVEDLWHNGLWPLLPKQSTREWFLRYLADKAIASPPASHYHSLLLMMLATGMSKNRKPLNEWANAKFRELMEVAEHNLIDTAWDIKEWGETFAAVCRCCRLRTALEWLVKALRVFSSCTFLPTSAPGLVMLLKIQELQAFVRSMASQDDLAAWSRREELRLVCNALIGLWCRHTPRYTNQLQDLLEAYDFPPALLPCADGERWQQLPPSVLAELLRACRAASGADDGSPPALDAKRRQDRSLLGSMRRVCKAWRSALDEAVEDVYNNTALFHDLNVAAMKKFTALRGLHISTTTPYDKGNPERWVAMAGWGLAVSRLRGILDRLPRLLTLEFRFNAFNSVPVQFHPLQGERAVAGIAGCTRLRRLGLTMLGVPSLQRGLAALSNLVLLEELDLSRNHFDSPLPTELAGLPALTKLVLSHNRFPGVPLPLASMPMLRDLRLGPGLRPAFFLTDATVEEVSRCTQLQLLDLSGSSKEVHILPTTKLTPLSALGASLTALSLSNHYFTDWPPVLNSLTCLRQLHLRANWLTHIPRDITHLQLLEHLDVSVSPLEGGVLTLPQGIRHLGKLVSVVRDAPVMGYEEGVEGRLLSRGIRIFHIDPPQSHMSSGRPICPLGCLPVRKRQWEQLADPFELPRHYVSEVCSARSTLPDDEEVRAEVDWYHGGHLSPLQDLWDDGYSSDSSDSLWGGDDDDAPDSDDFDAH